METITPKLLSWASILDWPTREQAIKTASMPFVYPYLALMPDAHLGKGATVGSVIPTQGAIMPAAVGVDIGCGMCAWRTDVHMNDEWLTRLRASGSLAALRVAIERAVPLSPGNYNQQWWRSSGTKRRIAELEQLNGYVSAEAIAPNWRLQLGSLGGGNHFIEITVDEDGWIWLFLHSGSRGVGNKLATKHIKVARDLCKAENVHLPDPDLAYLIEGSAQFDTYITDLRWAQRFAWLNREEMIERVHYVFGEWLSETSGDEFAVKEKVNCHHNYTEQETHGGELVWLSRKGAIDATEGTPGLIPGSMSAASYVVAGKGNAQALNSSPHGAGRAFSRSAAKREFTEDDLQASMAGIEWRRDSGRAFLDEIAGAYKPIDQVMADSADLVRVKHELHQLVNVKGE